MKSGSRDERSRDERSRDQRKSLISKSHRWTEAVGTPAHHHCSACSHRTASQFDIQALAWSTCSYFFSFQQNAIKALRDLMPRSVCRSLHVLVSLLWQPFSLYNQSLHPFSTLVFGRIHREELGTTFSALRLLPRLPRLFQLFGDTSSNVSPSRSLSEALAGISCL